MSAEVFSESLAFPQLKKRAVSARSFRVKIPSSNSTSFVPEQTINIDLPSNLQGQYWNFNQMYLKMTVTSTAAYTLDRAGALSFIKRLSISTAGAELCNIMNYNVLATAMMDTDATAEYKAGYGNVMLGTIGDALTGAQIGIGATTFAIPIVLNPLAQTSPHRMIPAFSLSSIQMRLTLDSEVNAVKAAGAPGLTFSNVELVAMMCELSPGAQAQIDASTGGKYNILANSWMQSGGSLAAGITGLTANLGFSVSSLERIVAVHRPVDSVNVQGRYSLGNRGTAALAEYNYLINSEQYPARPVLVDSRGAESCAELLIADHALVDFKKGSGFNNGFAGIANQGYGQTQISGVDPSAAKAAAFMLVGTAASGSTAGAAAAAVAAGAALGTATVSDVGTFLASTEFESGLSDGKSATIYSGISTIASTVQWRGVYGAHAAAFDIDWFANFTVLLSLDMRGSGVWSVSV